VTDPKCLRFRRQLCESELSFRRFTARGIHIDSVRVRWLSMDALLAELAAIQLEEHVAMGRVMENVRR